MNYKDMQCGEIHNLNQVQKSYDKSNLTDWKT